MNLFIGALKIIVVNKIGKIYYFISYFKNIFIFKTKYCTYKKVGTQKYKICFFNIVAI